jgi:hypothetical protein
MRIIWGILLTVISALGWVGQVITVFWPKTAMRLGFCEPENDVDPVFFADGRGEAIWDTFILWTLPVAGVLLILAQPLWAYFGLVGAGTYLYFAGRGLVVRATMRRRGIRIGRQQTLLVANIFLFLWGLAAVVTVVLAIVL